MTAAHWLLHLAPELVLVLGACTVLLVGVIGGARRIHIEAFLTLATLALALWVSLQQGEPDGRFAALGLWLTSLTYYTRVIALLVGILILLVNWRQPVAEERGEYFAMILFSLTGVLLTASANDWLVLFFTIELVSIPTYVLIALSRTDARASEATVKYFFLGALAAAILAYGLSFLYGASGTTQIHAVQGGGAVSLLLGGNGELGAAALVGILLTICGLAFKIAAVPFHVYAPDVYEGAAAPVTGLLGFVPKFAGFVALIKVCMALEWRLPTELMWLLWVLAAATMTAGNVLALLQHNVKRMLAYSSIAHTGYMLVGLLVGPVAGEGPLSDGVAALLFYIAAYGAMNLGAFALLSFLKIGERELETLDDLSGIAARAPAATLAFAICILSLMGLPPTGGFMGKLYLFGSAFSVAPDRPFRAALMALAIIGVLNSAVGAAYYLRLVAAAYMGKREEGVVDRGGWAGRIGLALCSLPMLLLFAWPAVLATRARSATAIVQRVVREGQSRHLHTLSTDAPRSALTELAEPAALFSSLPSATQSPASR